MALTTTLGFTRRLKDFAWRCLNIHFLHKFTLPQLFSLFGHTSFSAKQFILTYSQQGPQNANMYMNDPYFMGMPQDGGFNVAPSAPEITVTSQHNQAAPDYGLINVSEMLEQSPECLRMERASYSSPPHLHHRVHRITAHGDEWRERKAETTRTQRRWTFCTAHTNQVQHRSIHGTPRGAQQNRRRGVEEKIHRIPQWAQAATAMACRSDQNPPVLLHEARHRSHDCPVRLGDYLQQQLWLPDRPSVAVGLSVSEHTARLWRKIRATDCERRILENDYTDLPPCLTRSRSD